MAAQFTFEEREGWCIGLAHEVIGSLDRYGPWRHAVSHSVRIAREMA